MIDIFEQHAPLWRSAVTQFARSVWKGEDGKEADSIYDKKAIMFAKEYRRSLEDHYRKKGLNVYRGTLDGYVTDWLRKQEALKNTLRTIAEEKQSKLFDEEMERLRKEKDAQAMINRLYEAKETESIYKVFTFKDHFKDLAGQRGDENAYELGTKINERIISEHSDRYFWSTQKDKRVRNTHQQLNAKCFLFADPPTTIDRYGKKFTGNPGIDYGCRCWAEIAPAREKVLRGFVVYENRSKK